MPESRSSALEWGRDSTSLSSPRSEDRSASMARASSTTEWSSVWAPWSSHRTRASSLMSCARVNRWRSVASRSWEYASRNLSRNASEATACTHAISTAGSPTHAEVKPAMPTTEPRET